MHRLRRILTSYQGIATVLSLAVFAACLLTMSSCDKSEPPPPPAPTEKPTPRITEAAPAMEGSNLYLSQAQFIKETDPATGETTTRPGPARLVIWSMTADGWQKEVVEDSESDVFHKAAWSQPVQGEPGILTIGAREAQLKIWRKNDAGEWSGESLWNPTFGRTSSMIRIWIRIRRKMLNRCLEANRSAYSRRAPRSLLHRC